MPGSGATIGNALTSADQVCAHYKLYPLDWTVVATSSVACSGGVFTLAVAHGLAAGDSVYLDGDAANAKPAGSYLVTGVPGPKSFTLDGVAAGASDIYRLVAKIKQSPGALSF